MTLCVAVAVAVDVVVVSVTVVELYGVVLQFELGRR